MKLPDHILRYFLLAALLLIAGIVIIILQTAMIHQGLDRFDARELKAQEQYHTTTVMPFMATYFPGFCS